MKRITIAIIALSIILSASLGYPADSSSVSVTATIVSRGFCWFMSGTAALDFGNLDPSNPIDVTASTSISFRCFRLFNSQVTFFIGDDDGSYETGPDANRMQHSTMLTEYLPYSFSLNPTSGTIPGNPFVNRTLNVTGTVRGADYQDIATGSYLDRVVITIQP